MANVFTKIFRREKEREPLTKKVYSSDVGVTSVDGFFSLCESGYTRLSDNPEIRSAVGKIAELIASMTIQVMENSDVGDVRIKDAFSKKLDIDPNPYTTRKTFIEFVVRTLLLEGEGNAFVLPVTKSGYLEGLYPVPACQASVFQGNTLTDGYTVYINGIPHNPANLLHFIANPSPTYPYKGEGYRVSLKDVASTLAQANITKKKFMKSEWRPGLIVKLDSGWDPTDVEDEKEIEAARERREKLVKQYQISAEVGAPWLIPSEEVDVQPITPLSLNDIAINETVTLDKRTVASILGVPAYVVGVGDFKKDEWNNFIQTRIMPLVKGMEQEMTKKLMVSPKRYVKFNLWSLYSYNIQELAGVGMNLYSRGIFMGNEVRDWLGKEPLEGLDQLIVLENYIPSDKIGDQKKLYQGGDENGE